MMEWQNLLNVKQWTVFDYETPVIYVQCSQYNSAYGVTSFEDEHIALNGMNYGLMWHIYKLVYTFIGDKLKTGVFALPTVSPAFNCL